MCTVTRHPTALYVSAQQTMVCEVPYVIYSTTMREAMEG